MFIKLFFSVPQVIKFCVFLEMEGKTRLNSFSNFPLNTNRDKANSERRVGDVVVNG